MVEDSIRDYEGRRVRLIQERREHIARHHGIDVSVDEIRAVLESPGLVVESPIDPEARLYYRLHERGRFEGKLTCVVVVVSGDDAFVATAMERTP